MHNLRGSEAAGKQRAIHARHAKTCEAQITVPCFGSFRLRSVLEAIPRIYLVDLFVNQTADR